MKHKKSLIISALPLTPILSGMQNTVYLLYKFLKEQKQKVAFLEVKTHNKADPVVNLKHNFFFSKKLNNKIINYNPDFIFVNTSKILNIYKEILLYKYRFFKTVLVIHDLYYYRKRYLNYIKIKDSTYLTKKKEISTLKKADFIIDYSKKEYDFLLSSGIKKKQLVFTMTPTLKLKNNYRFNAKYDIIYISSDWLQNQINIKWIKDQIQTSKNKFKLLVLGNKKFLRRTISKKDLFIKDYSKISLNLAKLGLAIFNSGTGRKTKIFEMLSAGLPVVSNLDLSEFGLRNNKHYIKISKGQIINKILIDILNNIKLRKNLSKNALNWSKKNSYYYFAFKNLKTFLNK